MGESGGRRRRGATAILLGGAIIGSCTCGQRLAVGAEPPSLSVPVDGEIRAVQESRSSSAPAELRTVMREVESSTRQPSRKRRRPQMAGVPTGTRLSVQDTQQAEIPSGLQTVEQEAGSTSSGFVLVEQKATAQDAAGIEPDGQQVTARESIGRPPAKLLKASAQLDDAPKTRYALAPVKIKGKISASLYRARSFGKASSSSWGNLQSAEVGVSTYVLEKWVAEVGGGIGLVHAKSTSDNQASSSDNSFFGHARASLFNRSRFPFVMGYQVSDSRSSGELTNDTKSKVLTLKQSYRPKFGTAKYLVGYDRTDSTGELLADRSVSSLLHGLYEERLNGEQQVWAKADLDKKRSGGGASVSTNVLKLSHVYLPEESLLSVMSEGGIQQVQAPGVLARYLQLATNLSWQPEDEDLNMYVSGGGSFFQSWSSTALAGRVASRAMSGNASLSYQVSPTFSLGADGSIVKSDSGGKSQLSTTQRGTAKYRAEVVRLGDASYRWNANGLITNRTGAKSVRGVGGHLAHSVNIPFSFELFGRKDKISLEGGQTLSANVNSIDGWSNTLSNRVNLAWSLGGQVHKALPGITDGTGIRTGGDSNLSAKVFFSASDTRVKGKTTSNERNISFGVDLGGGGLYSISGYGANFGLRLGVTRGRDGKIRANAGGVGTASYRKVKPFGVQGLVYGANFDMNTRQYDSDSLQAGSLSASQQMNYSMDQRLTYRIGENEVRLNGYLASQGGQKISQLFLVLRSWRNFSN